MPYKHATLLAVSMPCVHAAYIRIFQLKNLALCRYKHAADTTATCNGYVYTCICLTLGMKRPGYEMTSIQLETKRMLVYLHYCNLAVRCKKPIE